MINVVIGSSILIKYAQQESILIYFKAGLLWALLFTVSLCSKEIVLPMHTIFFKGQKNFSEETLRDALDVKGKNVLLFWKTYVPKIEDKLIPELENSLKSFYESEGFYDAKFKLKETKEHVSVSVHEGKPIIIKEIKVTSDYPIKKRITFSKNRRFRAKEFIKIKSSIIKKLLNDGYCSYALDSKAYVDLEKHTAQLKYDLKKGGVCTFGKTNINGLETIDTDIVRSRVVAKEGRRFDLKKIKESYSAIYGLNAFDSIVVNTDRKIYNVVPIDITLTELEKPYHYEIGAGYDSYVGPRVHGLITKRNFLGNAQKITAKAMWSQKEQLIELDFFKPSLFKLFGYAIDFGAVGGYSNLEYRGFKEKKGYSKIYLEHNEGRVNLMAGLALENIDISLLDNLRRNQALRQAVNEGTFLLLYPFLNAVYDARDHKLNPKHGYYLAGYTEYGMPYKENASSYIKTLIEGRVIHTLQNKLTLSFVAKAGVIDQTKNEIPESKLLFAGGSYFNRAYGYNEIGVILSPERDSMHGASTMLNGSFEVNYPITDLFYGALFSDNTMLTDESYDFTGEYINTLGVGVRYITPIGPFKLDVGFNTHDTSQYGISFQIGQSF